METVKSILSTKTRGADDCAAAVHLPRNTTFGGPPASSGAGRGATACFDVNGGGVATTESRGFTTTKQEEEQRQRQSNYWDCLSRGLDGLDQHTKDEIQLFGDRDQVKKLIKEKNNQLVA